MQARHRYGHFLPAHSRTLANIQRPSNCHCISMDLGTRPRLHTAHHGYSRVPNLSSLDVDISKNRHGGIVHLAADFCRAEKHDHRLG